MHWSGIAAPILMPYIEMHDIWAGFCGLYSKKEKESVRFEKPEGLIKFSWTHGLFPL